MVYRRRQTAVNDDNVDIRGGTIENVEIGRRVPSRGFFSELVAKVRMGIGTNPVSTTILKIANTISSALSGVDQAGVDVSVLGSASGTDNLAVYIGAATTANAAYTCALMRTFRAKNATKLGASAITLQIAYDAEDLTSGVSNYAYRGQVSSGAGKFNLYMSGTAINYLAGNLLLGTLTDGMTAGGSLAIAQDFAHRGAKFGAFNTAPIAKPAAAGDNAFATGAASIAAALAALGIITDSTTTTPTNVTGSRGGNAALANLLTALAAQGFITDGTVV